MAGQDWQALTRLTGGATIEVERVRIVDPQLADVAIEGRFELPSLARLAAEDQVFVAAFVRCHGSIKEMEQMFGVSYPTIKNRLNRLSEQLPLAGIEPAVRQRPDATELLARLERGEITARDVLNTLKSKAERKTT